MHLKSPKSLPTSKYYPLFGHWLYEPITSAIKYILQRSKLTILV